MYCVKSEINVWTKYMVIFSDLVELKTIGGINLQLVCYTVFTGWFF